MSRVPWNFRWRSGEHQAALTVLSVAVGADSLACDMPFECGPERWEVQVAVDRAELLGRLDHARGAPAQRHLCVWPVTMKGAVLAEMLTSSRSGLSDAYSSTPHAVADFIAGIDPDADYYVGAVEV